MSDQVAQNETEGRIGQRYKVAIRENETGEVRVVDTGAGCPWMAGSEYWLRDGNYGCDCNREMAFRGDGDIDVECGEGRFSILYAEFPDGERITIDE
jgi:hypothetical protein